MAGWAISQLLLGCSNQSATRLKIELLRGSFPTQLLDQFKKQQERSTGSIDLDVSTQPQVQSLFSLLQELKRSGKPSPPSRPSWLSWLDAIPWIGQKHTGIPDLVTLGDYWLGKAVEQSLLKPIDTTVLKGWASVSQHLQLKDLLTRNPQGQIDPNGQVWGVPYRLGTTVIAYRQDIFSQRGLKPPTDWGDLWRSDLRRRISLPDQPREVIGLVLKKMGQSYNTTDLSKVANLEQELRTLHQQVRLYSSDSYLQPLLLEDTWLAVGWSTDVLPLTQQSSEVAVVVPQSGTALWADLWVRPAATADSQPPVVTSWLDYCGLTEIAPQLAIATWAISPALLGMAPNTLPESFRKSLDKNPAILPNPKILQASEFIKPLPQTAAEQYERLWLKIRKEK
jgi:putative spermidine/putrescine transport system substrate-binding protein